MAKVTKVHHVAIVVGDIDQGLDFWRDKLGLQYSHTEDVPSQKSQVAFMHAGETEIELVKPTSDDSGVAKFLAEKGPGMHHVCVEVDNIEEMMADLKAKGVRLINETPSVLPGRKMAFVHPKATSGVLLELYEVTD